MVLEKVLFFHQRRILGELLRNVSVIAEKFTEVAMRVMIAIDVVTAVTIVGGITANVFFTTVVASFAFHEGVRILPQLFANSRMVLQIRLQSRMVFQELLVIRE